MTCFDCTSQSGASTPKRLRPIARGNAFVTQGSVAAPAAAVPLVLPVAIVRATTFTVLFTFANGTGADATR